MLTSWGFRPDHSPQKLLMGQAKGTHKFGPGSFYLILGKFGSRFALDSRKRQHKNEATHCTQCSWENKAQTTGVPAVLNTRPPMQLEHFHCPKTGEPRPMLRLVGLHSPFWKKHRTLSHDQAFDNRLSRWEVLLANSRRVNPYDPRPHLF